MEKPLEDCPGFQPASQVMAAGTAKPAVEDDAVIDGDLGEVNADEAPVSKKRRVHLDACQIESHANTAEGAQALVDPLNVPKSSKDPNRGLYPRLPAPPQGGFTTASAFKREEDAALPGPSSNEAAGWQNNGASNYSGFSRVSKKPPPQKNNLKNYFSPSSSPQKIKTEPESSQNSGASAASFALKTEPVGVKTEIKTEPNVSSGPSRAPRGRGSIRGKRSKPGKAPSFNRDNAFLYDTSLAKPVTKSKPADNKYGLFGTGEDAFSSEEDDDLAYFDWLPTELVENILCRLPLMDLMLNVSLVCRRWNHIISGEKFVPWKKKYHQLKLGDEETRTALDNLLREKDCKTRENYLPGVVRLAKDIKIPTEAMNRGLKKHPLYECAADILKERLPDCMENGVPNAYSVIAMIVIIAKTVSEISLMMKQLLMSSACSANELLECLYFINTFLLRFKLLKAKEVWNGMHYRLFYALYLYENEFVTTARELKSHYTAQAGQQSIMRYSEGNTSVQMTHEQVRICKHELAQNDVVKIVAFAGTGKTTTLVKYTQMRPNKKFLLVVYNKSVSNHAKGRFPNNVKVMTGHALAYAVSGRRYAAAGKLQNKVKLTTILDHFRARKGEAMYVQAQFIMDTIVAFQASSDFEISKEHAPTFHKDKDGLKVPLSDDWKQFYVEQATKIWNKMYDFRDKMHITHDGYMKAYQLNRPTITGHDVILIDEAQDMTPALSWVLLRQSQPKVLVGDPHQQIYAFRGATNAMQQIEASHTFYLTQSFRFGPEISYIASCCLEFLKHEKKKTLVGNGIPGAIDGSTEGQLAIITRGNFTLFGEAVKKLCYSDAECRPAFVGGTEGFGFDMILDIYLLMCPPAERRNKAGRDIRNPFINRFGSLPELEKFAEKTTDPELLGKIKIVKTYNHQIPSLLSTIKRKCINDVDSADLVFSTAHKAKGLEFSTVRLTNDYNIGLNPVIGQPTNLEDENNVLYVAITRAKKKLILNETLLQMFSLVGERFLFPEHSQALVQKETTFTCYKTHQPFDPLAATLVRQRLRIESGDMKGGGVVSPKTVSREFPAWAKLLGHIPQEGEEEDEEDDDDFFDNFDNFDDDMGNFKFSLLRGMNVPVGNFVFHL